MKKKKCLILAFVIGAAFFCIASAATSKFVYELDGTITICDIDDSTACITIQDRNLGATSNDINSDKSYGYHFQWGNNHGFKAGNVNTQNHVVFPNGESTGAFQIDCSSYSPENPLDRDVFMIGEPDYFNSEFDYCDTHNYGLWGGGDDYYETNWGYNTETHLVNNVKGRQGPCPEGYHIPSNGEWHALLEFWVKNYGNGLELRGAHLVKQVNINDNGSEKFNVAKNQLIEDLKIPLAGSRDWYKAYIGGIGQTAMLWSSSPYIDYDSVHAFSVGINGIAAGSTAPFANAYSIRCFKNVPMDLSGANRKNNVSANDKIEVKNNHVVCNLKQYDIKNVFVKILNDRAKFLNYLKCVK